MPRLAKGPKKLNETLESVYRRAIVDGASKESAARQAWGAAKRQGWKKVDGVWRKVK